MESPPRIGRVRSQWSVLLKGVPLSLPPVPRPVSFAMTPTHHVLWVGELEGSFGVLSWMPGSVQAFE